MLLVTLAILLAHAAEYRFLTDDAYISFRYARNLATGDGLVFNPGGEPVEGYTNFLWVVVLAGLDAVGWSPESSSTVLTLSLTVALWALVVWFAWRTTPDDRRRWLAVLPALFLAATRSVAVWSTGGLETRLFEVLVVAGALRLIVELEKVLAADHALLPVSGGLLALATLTRPDGLLIAGCLYATAGAILAVRRRLPPGPVLRGPALYAAVVGAHYLFHRIYYGDWFPNTYYAKVGGERWWSMGLAYLESFVLEYGLWLWVPLLALALRRHRRLGSLWRPALFGALVLPHAFYIVSIGGDHFEYRPFDLYFPFLFLLIPDGVLEAIRLGRRGRVSVALYATSLLVLLAWLPWRSHGEFPGEYLTGFPGAYEDDQGEVFLAPERDPLYGLPGLAFVARRHKRLLMHTTQHFVGLRQEEHALFLETVIGEGRALARLVDAGLLPIDTHVAIDSVGAMPYYSGLRTLDRLGLTDKVVARQEMEGRRRLAHDKHATIEYARERGVDLWAVHPVHLLFPIESPDLFRRVFDAHRAREEAYLAEVRPGLFLLCRLPQGGGAARRRFPELDFRELRSPGALEALLRKGADAYRSLLDRRPDAVRARATLAEILRWLGRVEESAAEYAKVVADHPEILEAHNNLGLALLRLGRTAEAVARLQRAREIAPDDPIVLLNLGAALERAGRADEGISAARRALEIDPALDPARSFLCDALRRRGRPAEAAPYCNGSKTSSGG